MENIDRPARPWDLFNRKIQKVTEEIGAKRLSICNECPKFIKTTGQCKTCMCFMRQKVKLPNASCPLGKWKALPYDLHKNGV